MTLKSAEFENNTNSKDKGYNQIQNTPVAKTRHDWQISGIRSLHDMPFNDLLFKAHTVHRENFDPNEIQLSTLLNIKTGGCPEDCSYCSQSIKNNTGMIAGKLIPLDDILQKARKAKSAGADRFCMGAAWRDVKDRDLGKLSEIVEGVKKIGLETCMTLGMLTADQAKTLKDAGLDFYNHNIDTSETFYPSIVTTRKFSDRLDTLSTVQAAGIKVCSGGILGLGESIDDRLSMLQVLANLQEHPKSLPINMLVPIEGTPLAESKEVVALDLIRIIAVARIMMPQTVLRLSAGRSSLSDEAQAMAFFAGAGSIFYGDELLTTSNPVADKDDALLSQLGLRKSGGASSFGIR